MASGSIVVMRLQVSDWGTYLLDHRQHPRFGIVVSVSASTQIDFPREGVGFIRCCELKDAVRGCKGDIFPVFWIHALRCRSDTTAIVDLGADAHRQTSLQC